MNCPGRIIKYIEYYNFGKKKVIYYKIIECNSKITKHHKIFCTSCLSDNKDIIKDYIQDSKCYSSNRIKLINNLIIDCKYLNLFIIFSLKQYMYSLNFNEINIIKNIIKFIRSPGEEKIIQMIKQPKYISRNICIGQFSGYCGFDKPLLSNNRCDQNITNTLYVSSCYNYTKDYMCKNCYNESLLMIKFLNLKIYIHESFVPAFLNYNRFRQCQFVNDKIFKELYFELTNKYKIQLNILIHPDYILDEDE